MAKLVATAGNVGWSEFRLTGDAVIGRAPDCDVRIEEPWISRRHAALRPVQGRYWLEDLKTPFGTFVNGRKVTKVELNHGDKIVLGDYVITFDAEGIQAAPREKAPPRVDATIISTLDPRKRIESETAADPTKVAQLRTHLKVLQQVSETACTTLEINALLKNILQQLLEVFPQATHAHAVLFNMPEPGHEIRLSSAKSGKNEGSSQISSTLLDIVTREQKAVLASDPMADDRFSQAASILSLSLRSIICSPLVIGDEVLGAIQVDTTSVSRLFTTDDLHLMTTVAGQIAVAALNARLHHELVSKERLAAIGETVSSVAHCIKNVLSAMQGGAYVLDLGITNDEKDKVTKGWGIVKRNTDFMLDLAKDMLAYCKKEAVERKPADMTEMLSGVMLMIQESAAQKGIHTPLSLEKDLPVIGVDETGLKRAILNLMTNAVEACKEGQSVGLTAVRDRSTGHMVITISDTGPGMPEKVRARIFEPFFTTKGNRGTGLGLPLVKKVVEAHGGRLDLESEVGRGTTFRIVLPEITA
jgi:signal transduction histidine kinase